MVTWLVVTLAAVGLAAGVIRPFLPETIQMPSKSMYPTLLVGDRVFADKLHRTPKRGDVILFKYPLDQSADYIKRVIGLAGDVVEISHGTVRVNGVELPREVVQKNCPKGPDGITIFENAIPCVLWNETVDGHTYKIGTDTVMGERPMQRIVVPPGTVFVIGDNRDNSSDSRVWGSVRLESIKGTVTFILGSSAQGGVRWDRVDTLER
jgi:signal peptidase I